MFELLTKEVEFRGRVYTIREMSARERAEWSELPRELTGDLIVHAVHRQTQWSEPVTFEALRDAPTAMIETLGRAILELSGITNAEDDPEKKA